MPVRAVPSLDLTRYLGRWYEICRLPLNLRMLKPPISQRLTHSRMTARFMSITDASTPKESRRRPLARPRRRMTLWPN